MFSPLLKYQKSSISCCSLCLLAPYALSPTSCSCLGTHLPIFCKSFSAVNRYTVAYISASESELTLHSTVQLVKHTHVCGQPATRRHE